MALPNRGPTTKENSVNRSAKGPQLAKKANGSFYKNKGINIAAGGA